MKGGYQILDFTGLEINNGGSNTFDATIVEKIFKQASKSNLKRCIIHGLKNADGVTMNDINCRVDLTLPSTIHISYYDTFEEYNVILELTYTSSSKTYSMTATFTEYTIKGA